MWNRVFAVFRAGFEAQWGRGLWPVAPLVVHGSIAAVFALLVRDELPPYGYAVFMLSIAMALVALPLLGDFASLLRADASREWIEAQPIRAFELRLARTLLALLLIGALAASALLPIALFAPSGVGVGARIMLFAAGTAQALTVAALLLGLQSVLGRRAEALLVLLQTLLVGGVMVGCLVGLQFIPQLTGVHNPADLASGFAWLPPAWFATAVSDGAALDWSWRAAPWIALVSALFVLFSAPQPSEPRGRRASWMSFVLAPLRGLATRSWVRRGERGPFDLVFDALPLEREFVLRTYPLIAIPLAMLFAGSSSGSDIERNGLVAVLLFTPATYLPVLLVHVPASASAEARWILDGAPQSRATIANGAIKALTVRFLLPLYALLFALAWSRAGLEFALFLTPIGFLVSLALMRRLYDECVSDTPLSTDPDEIKADLDWTGKLLGIGLVLTVVAILAMKFVTTAIIAFAVCAVLIFLEWNANKRVLVNS